MTAESSFFYKKASEQGLFKILGAWLKVGEVVQVCVFFVIGLRPNGHTIRRLTRLEADLVANFRIAMEPGPRKQG